MVMMVCSCVPIREYILPKKFTEEDLKHLDPFSESDEDLEEEK
jgi:hypothetical protein